MNRGIFSFPRNGALEARSVRTPALDAGKVATQTLTATGNIQTSGTSATSTGIKLVGNADLGSLFRPASYTAVQSASVVNQGDNQNCGGALSVSVSGNALTIFRNTNCNCACSTDS